MSSFVFSPSEMPAIPGLIMRHFQDEADFPGIARVINLSLAADGNCERVSLEGLASTFAHPVHWDPQKDSLFVVVDGMSVGYANTEWHEDGDGACLHCINLYLVPEWRGRGLEPVMQRIMERCARAVVSNGQGFAHNWFTSLVPDSWQARADMLQSSGYAPAHTYFEMQRPLDGDLPEINVPVGLMLRQPLPEHYRAVWDASVECFREQRDYFVSDEESYQAWIALPDLDPDVWIVAWDGNQVAGAAINTLHEGAWGETDDLFVRRPWRRQGLGRALLAASLHLFKERGLVTAGLGVDVDNVSGAPGLYENVGFRPYQRVVSYRKAMGE